MAESTPKRGRRVALAAAGLLATLLAQPVRPSGAPAAQPGDNTFAGTQQRVVLTDPYFASAEYRSYGSEHPIELTFAEVIAPGLTSLSSRSDLQPAPPVDLQAGSPPYYYDILTTAGFTGNIRLCFNVRGMSFAQPHSELQIHTLTGESWTPLANQEAPASDLVCGDTPALGTFAIFYPQVPSTAIVTFAGTGLAEGAIDGPGGDPGDDVVDDVAATESALTSPGRLARDAAGHVYVGEGAWLSGWRIRRIAPNGIISTVVGPGVCDGSLPLAVDPAGHVLYCVRWNQWLHDVVRVDLPSLAETVLATVPEVGAMGTDAGGNLFFSDHRIYRVAASGGTPELVFGFQSIAPLSLPYFDRIYGLAFDAAGHLLAGGQTLIRIAPGGDGLIDGSPDETVEMIGGIRPNDLAGYSQPFFGDGLAASEARLGIANQMIVASDGAVVFSDMTNRIRRIAPGADGIVSGGGDETVRTIAGYTAFMLGNPSPFATSEFGSFRGVLEDPRYSGAFIVASNLGHKLQRFGIPPEQGGGGSSDTTPPVLTLPADITTLAVDATGAMVAYDATALDAVDGAVAPVCVPASGSLLPLGTTTVACTAADRSGNVAGGSFSVSVVDGTPPVLSLPANLTFAARSPSGTVVTYPASATDNVSGAVTPSCTPASGTLFPVGTTTVTCTARDAAGNVSAGTFTVTVTTTVSPLDVVAVTFTTDGEQYLGAMTVQNVLPLALPPVMVTEATLNRVPSTSLPVSLGTIAPGAAVTRQLRFPGSAGVPGDQNTLRMTFSWAGRPISVSRRVTLPAMTAPLAGWVDLHTHPMSNLAFGGKLFHGAPDVGSLMPAIQMPYDLQCRFDVRAISIDEALSDDAPTHGDPIQSRCGDFLRNAAVQALEQFNHAIRQPAHAVGSPTFVNWPRWNDITHQKMWIDWIRRAKDGGLRVMVALSHNNRTIAEVLGSGGPISGAKDDRASSDLQVAEIRAFVNRHPTLMQIALTSAELYQIVQSGRIAVILGVELDNIGNFNDLPGVTPQMVEAEIDRLYAQGVRYAFPVHLADNVFGDTAIYSTMFNIANRRETGAFWSVGCASLSDRIGFRSLNVPPELNIFLPPGTPQPPRAPDCLDPYGAFLGHVNARNWNGVTPLGDVALKAMMKRGMIVDVDHMSDRGVEAALRLAEGVVGGGYPLVSGHSGVRDGNHFKSENARTRAQLQRIGCLQGMFGLGTDGAEAYDWARQYVDAFNEMGQPTLLCPDKTFLGHGRVALGTDINSLVSTPRPTMTEMKPGTLPRFTDIYNPSNPANDNPFLPVLGRSTTGTRTWDYNFDGVAHYGMFADFVKDVRTAPTSAALARSGRDIVDNHLLRSADYFFRMWQKIEVQKSNVR